MRGDLFFDSRPISALLKELKVKTADLSRRLTVMEVCGTHTHTIAGAGLRRLLPDGIRLISGPGCPVCVTPVSYLDRAEALAARPNTLVCTFGDLFRVPSSRGSLEQSKADGTPIRIVYSPRDALDLARKDPDTKVIFLGVGFETTAPLIAAALLEAEEEGIGNFLVLSGHKVIPPPMRALAGDSHIEVDGFILPGHVSVITGAAAFDFLASEYGLPSVVTGFSPVDVLRSLLDIVRQKTTGQSSITNLYGAAVSREGNATAQRLMNDLFEPADSEWRGLGTIPESGLVLRSEWSHLDASRIDVVLPEPREPKGCRCGEILKGQIDPPECPLFGGACTPDSPVGACMVSSEGTCAAWYRYERPVSTSGKTRDGGEA